MLGNGEGVECHYDPRNASNTFNFGKAFEFVSSCGVTRLEWRRNMISAAERGWVLRQHRYWRLSEDCPGEYSHCQWTFLWYISSVDKFKHWYPMLLPQENLSRLIPHQPKLSFRVQLISVSVSECFFIYIKKEGSMTGVLNIAFVNSQYSGKGLVHLTSTRACWAQM